MQDGGPPLAALPNIGLASLLGGRVIYPHATPEYFAEFAAQARDLGARADRRLLRHDADRDRRDPRRDRRGPPGARRGSTVNEREAAIALGEEQRETRARARPSARGEFVVSVQLDPPLGGSSRGLLEVGGDARGLGRSSASSTSTTTRPRARGSAR